MNNITFEIALDNANKIAEKYGKIVVIIEENDEYWYFGAGVKDGVISFDNNAGSVFISKKDGSERFENFPISDFCKEFNKTAKVKFDYYKENGIEPHTTF